MTSSKDASLTPYSEAKALKALAQISDPLTGADIISAGRLATLSCEDGLLQAVLQIPPPEVEKFFPIREAAQKALAKLGGVSKATVVLSAHKAGPNLAGGQSAPKRKGNPHQPRRPQGYQGDSQIARIIAISSAKGGVGKSTLAVNLAVAMAKSGQSVGLLDADIHGPSVPMLLGLSGEMAKTTKRADEKGEERRLITPLSAHGIKAMSIGFLTPDDGPIVWRGPMVQGAISRMLWDVDWGALDTLIIDMPPGTGDAQLGLAQDIKPKGAVIVSTPQDLALLDARKGVAMFGKVDIPVIGLIENMAVFTCPDCGSEHHIFGSGGAQRDADALGISYLGAAPLDMDIRLSADAGKPIAGTDKPAADIFARLAAKI